MCLTCLRKNGIRAKKPFLSLIYEKRVPHLTVQHPHASAFQTFIWLIYPYKKGVSSSSSTPSVVVSRLRPNLSFSVS